MALVLMFLTFASPTSLETSYLLLTLFEFRKSKLGWWKISFIYRFSLLFPLHPRPISIVEPGENRLYLLFKVIYLSSSISKKEYYYKKEKIYQITTIKNRQFNYLFLSNSLIFYAKFILYHKNLHFSLFRNAFKLKIK